MKAPHALSLRDRHKNSEKAYGNIKRNESLEKLFGLEDIIDAIAPLPTTYDVLPIQPFYFSEFGYTDFWGGLYLYPMGYEASAQVMERAVKTTLNETGGNLDWVQTPTFSDKYALIVPSAECKRIVFLPGSNLLHAIDFQAVERLLFNDETIMVKPHPITTLEGLRMLASKVGFDRIIDPRESGMEYLSHCEMAWGTANSEIGLRAALMGVQYSDITANQYLPNMTYSALHRLLTNDVDHNYKVVKAAIAAPNSGLIMPWHSEEETVDRIRQFFKSAMEVRDLYRPMYPRSTPLRFGPQQSQG